MYKRREIQDDVVKFYKKAIISLDNLIKFDVNKYSKPVYEENKKNKTNNWRTRFKKRRNQTKKVVQMKILKEQLSGYLVIEIPNVFWDNFTDL